MFPLNDFLYVNNFLDATQTFEIRHPGNATSTTHNPPETPKVRGMTNIKIKQTRHMTLQKHKQRRTATKQPPRNGWYETEPRSSPDTYNMQL